jgi:hypothetical protein
MGYNVGMGSVTVFNANDAFIPDDLVGWKIKPGVHVFSVDGENSFTATIDQYGNRVSSYDECKHRRPKIHLYGCSFTFGYSVEDSSTCSFKLQNMLPDFKVENKGGCGYSLTQMYLSLKQSLVIKDTPVVAVFNYAEFQEQRSPLNREHSSIFYSENIISNKSKLYNIKYPYMDIRNDSLVFSYRPVRELTRYWGLNKYSAMTTELNKRVNYYLDSKNDSLLHIITVKTAIDIMKFCKTNNIIPVFASVTPDSEDILEILSREGYLTLDYNITINDALNSFNKYNCGPSDPWHPNELAHTIYADSIYNILVNNKIINSY